MRNKPTALQKGIAHHWVAEYYAVDVRQADGKYTRLVDRSGKPVRLKSQFTVDVPAVGADLSQLLGPIAAIQVCGTSAELEIQLQTIRDATTAARSVPLLDDANRDRVCWDLAGLERYYRHLAEKVDVAEKTLAGAGWRFDPRDGTIKAAMSKGQPGNRPALFLNSCIVAVADHICKDTTPADARRKKKTTSRTALRQAVKTFLLLFFDDDLLDGGPRGNIQNAIDNAKRPAGGKVQEGPVKVQKRPQ